jgi:hypothetical protein
MGVKSTKNFTRRELEDLYVEKKMSDPAIQRQFRAEAVLMSDTNLENAVERLNDELNDGEGFENYCIVD